jgi:tetratricopeptide (TPR) repeat protein
MPIAAADRWEQIALLSEGTLAEVPYAQLLLAMSRAGRTGVLELHRKPVEKRIIFEAGAPVDCRSNLVHETFSRFLVSVGKIDDEELRVALGESLAREVPIGEILLERGKLDAGELYKLLQQCLARKLLDGFTWREGSFRVSDDAAEVDSTLKVKVPQLILTGVLKLTPLEEVTRGLRPLFSEALARHDSTLVAEDDLQLRGPAAEVMAALRERPLRMDELAVRLPQLPPNDLGRIVYALALLEVVGPASRAPAKRAPAAPAPGDASTARGDESIRTMAVERPPKLSDGEVERARNRILQAYLSYRRRDAFDLLGVRETAAATEVEDAWLRYAQLYAPWPLVAYLPPDLIDKARALFLAGTEACTELRDGERRAVLVHRRRLAQAERANQPRGTAIKTDLLDPETQFRKGMELLAAGQERKALELLQYAADLDAQNPIYRAEAAMCRFRALGDTAKPLEELDEAVRADPRCGLAWYYLGVVQGHAGRRVEAEESLRKAIKLMAPDRRPIDALKDLTAKKR